ncbi:hypothetical protein Anas_07217 [Armadillidium nasatum]|uniref:Transmembrane protein n=1 Tax=Armadillidium nasatum TaxID=96803 RepID=A0A5N5TG57_9CRUS|nr:hypothetical protein Anas_07217 [Armadillidium nasatum]
MEPPNHEKAFIISIIVLKVVQISLQISLTLTSVETVDKLVIFLCVLVNLVFTLGNILEFLYQLAYCNDFKFENKVCIIFLTAYLMAIGSISMDLDYLFKSENNTSVKMTLNTYSRGNTERINPLNVHEEIYYYNSHYVKDVSLMVFIIVIQFIVCFIFRRITYDGPILWFRGEHNFPEENIPLSPVSSSNSASQEVGNVQSLTHRTTRASRRDSLETEITECEGTDSYAPLAGVKSKKVSTKRQSQDVDNLPLIDVCPTKRKHFPHIKEVRSHQCGNFHKLELPPIMEEFLPKRDSSNSEETEYGAVGGYDPLAGINSQKNSVEVDKIQASDNTLPTIKRKHFPHIMEERSHRCSDFHKLEFPLIREESFPKKESPDAEETEYGAVGGYAPQSGVNFQKNPAAEDKPQEDLDNFETNVKQRGSSFLP